MRNKSGQTPLHFAALYNRYYCVLTKSCPIFVKNVLHEIGQEDLDIRYYQIYRARNRELKTMIKREEEIRRKDKEREDQNKLKERENIVRNRMREKKVSCS